MLDHFIYTENWEGEFKDNMPYTGKGYWHYYDDVKFKGVLDTSTLGSGPQPDIVVILPGENDS